MADYENGDADDILAAIDRLADKWQTQRAERLQRRRLDPADFQDLADTGYLRLIVPEEYGGTWRSLAESAPTLVDAAGRLARGDHSVALVSSMHPAVLVAWTALEEAPSPHTAAWEAQRREVFASAMAGHFWGTLASEPGTGGDLLKTQSTATPIDNESGVFELRGQKHFGSGSEVVSYMITIAIPDGGEAPLGFYMDLRDQQWDGSAGLTISRPWDGVGMKATQSHAITLEGVHGTALAWPGAVAEASPYLAAMGLPMWVAIVTSIVDQAMAEAELRLGGRDLRPFEEVEWTRAQIDQWMIAQARDGIVRSLAERSLTEASVEAIKAKMGVAELAESLLTRISRAVGGSAFSASSPFASWFEDVRALGFLRPPWAMAFDSLAAARAHDEA